MGRKHFFGGSRLAKGYSLIEVVLVVGLISLMSAIGAPLYNTLSTSNELDVGLNVIVQDLYRAQSYSRNVADDKNWGVAINGQIVTLFRGTSYATRDTGFDDSYTLPSSISLTGSSQIIYDKPSGLPQSAASFSLSGGSKNQTVTVNVKGMVDY